MSLAKSGLPWLGLRSMEKGEKPIKHPSMLVARQLDGKVVKEMEGFVKVNELSRTAVICCAELVHGNVFACEDQLVGDLFGGFDGGIERVDDSDKGDLFPHIERGSLEACNTVPT